MKANSFAKFTALLVRWLAITGVFGLFILTIVTLVDVAMRNGLGYPILGLNELFVVFGGASVVAFLPFGIASRHLLTVRFIGNMVGSFGSSVLDYLANLVTLGFFGLLTWRVYIFMQNVLVSGETTFLLGWAIGPWWVWAVFCLTISFVAQACVLTGVLTEEMLQPDKIDDSEVPEKKVV